MNRFYRVVWNACTGTWQAVAETSRARGKTRSSRTASVGLALPLLLGGIAGHAADLPTQGRVVAGQGSLTQTSNATTIHQASDKLVIDWNSFSIGQGKSVDFIQPSSSSVALNRVLGSDVSVIQGALTSNGQVFLLNPNGITFSSTAQVSVGGLVASTLNLKTEDFLAGRYAFEGSGSNAIVNQGRISTAQGGSIALIAARILNDGQLTATAGSVLIGAGRKVQLDLGGPVKIEVLEGAIDALVRNGGAIRADGGLVYLTAKAAGDLASTVINNTGLVEAQTLANGKQGQIVLLGDLRTDRIAVSGQLDASAPKGGNGGSIETSAAEVDLAPTLKVSTLAPQGVTGQWLMDPYDVTIAASGGNVTGATISNALNTTNVTIDTTNASYGTGGSTSGTAYGTAVSAGLGDINVNDAIAKTGAGGTTLTLKANNDININAGITSTSGRLNVVLTADQDNSGAGNVNFGAAGHVVTGGGNFYVGAVSGTYDDVAAAAQDMTMAAGSYVDVGLGNLKIAVNGNISLPDNSAAGVTFGLSATNNTAVRYFDSGAQLYAWQLPQSYGQSVNLSSTNGSITTNNTAVGGADIVTSTDVRLSASTIGGAGAPIRASGPSDPYGLIANPVYNSETFVGIGTTLFIANEGGDTHVAETGTQIFKTVDLTVGNQVNSTQSVVLMGDAGGTSHILVNTDGSGVLTVGAAGISTGGVPGLPGTYNSTPRATDPSVFPTSVSLTAPAMTFDSGSVDTGPAVSYYQGVGSYYMQYGARQSYAASFTAYAPTSLTSSNVDGVADIKSSLITLSSSNIGTLAAPLEIGAVNTLTLNNGGGSTFVKVVDDSVNTLSFTTTNVAGEHHVLFSGGDHVDFVTSADGIYVPTIGGGASDGSNFSGTTGIDLSRDQRAISFGVLSGALELDTNSVNLGGGSFSVDIFGGNAVFNAGRAIFATHAFDGQAEVTAGNVVLSNDQTTTAGSIEGVEFAKGGSSTTNSFTLTSTLGDTSVRELTPAYFKSINLTLNGADTAQSISLGLAGGATFDIADSGSLITLSAAGADLSAGNRNFSLNAYSRQVEIDSVALSTGNYQVYAGQGLKLDGDVMTNGGSISLTAGGNGFVLMKSVNIDSNADDTGNTTSTGAAGSIFLNGAMSATAPGMTLSIDSGSTTGAGGFNVIYGNAGNAGGAFLAGLSLTSKGSAADNDGEILFEGNSYLLNGSFSAIGNTYLENAITIDTEQGNVANAGNITFGGSNLSAYYYGSLTLNASTTAAGMNAGNIDLADTFSHGQLSTQTVDVRATGGAGGASGTITLPSVTTAQAATAGTQTYVGAQVVLNGDLVTNQGAVAITGETQVASNVTIDTWTSASGAASGQAGSVTLNGGLSATAPGASLAIDTGTDTTGWFDAPTNTVAWNQGGGNVVVTGGSQTGLALGSLTVLTTARGAHEAGNAGTVAVGGIVTSGNQSYTSGNLTFTGDVTADKITIATPASGSQVSSSGVVTANQLALNGNLTTYSLDSGAGNAVGTLAVSGAQSLAFLNNDTALSIGIVDSTVGIGAVGTIAVATRAADLTVAANVSTLDTGASAITLNAGKDATAGTAAGGDIKIVGTSTFSTGMNAGLVTLLTGSVAGSTGVAGAVGSGSGNFRYGSDEAAQNFTTALASTGVVALYREQPTVTLAAGAETKTYDGLAFSGGGVVSSGFVNGDTVAAMNGTLAFGGTAQGATNAGSYTLTASGRTSGLGYAVAYTAGSLTVDKAALAVSVNDATKTYDANAFNGGNGVVLSGLVDGQTAASLGGTLAYGGTSQGATNAGSYTLSAAGLTSSNYDIAYASGALTVNKASLVATLDNVAKTYDGQAFQGGNGVALAGLAGGDNASVVTGTLAYGGNSQGARNAGSYVIAASGLSASNYDISYVEGTLAVGKAGLVATVDNAVKTYDAQAFVGGNGASFSGFVGTDNATGLGGALTYAGTSQGARNAGSYTLTASGLSSGNYVIAYVPGSLTVDKAPLVATANNAAKTYDGQAWSGGQGASFAGFVGGESAADLGGALVYGGASQSAKNAGNYALTTSGLSSGNYAIGYVPGSLTIAKADLVATLNDASKTYDGHAFNGGNGAALTGFVGGDSATDLAGALTYGGTSQGAKNAGSYTLTASGLSSINYAIAYAPGTLTVDKAALTVTANDLVKPYDGIAFAGGNGVTLSGLVGGDSSADLSGAAAYGGSAQGAIVAGGYGLSVSGLGSGNYVIAYVDGRLVVQQPLIRMTTAIAQAQDVVQIVPPQANVIAPADVSGGLALLQVSDPASGIRDGATGKLQVPDAAASQVVPPGFMKLIVLNGGVRAPSDSKNDGKSEGQQ